MTPNAMELFNDIFNPSLVVAVGPSILPAGNAGIGDIMALVRIGQIRKKYANMHAYF